MVHPQSKRPYNSLLCVCVTINIRKKHWCIRKLWENRILKFLFLSNEYWSFFCARWRMLCEVIAGTQRVDTWGRNKKFNGWVLSVAGKINGTKSIIAFQIEHRRMWTAGIFTISLPLFRVFFTQPFTANFSSIFQDTWQQLTPRFQT